MSNENYLKDSTKLIRKGCPRKNIQLLERVKNNNIIMNKLEEMEILRRQVYSLNKILESYLNRNASFYKKTALIVISKAKLFLQQWYELIRSHFKYKKPNIKMIQLYLYELLKYTQNLSIKFQREESYHIAYYYCNASKQVLEQLNGFKFKIWQHSSRDVWTDLIMGNMLLQNQNYELASIEFQDSLVRIQKNINQIINYKIEKSLPKEEVKKYAIRQMIMLFHIFFLLCISYLYSDNLSKYQELLKLLYYLNKHNQYNGEQSKLLKDFIKQHNLKLQIHLQEQGEIQKIMSHMYDVPEIQAEEKPNYIDEHFYKKYQVKEMNDQAFFRTKHQFTIIKQRCSIILKGKDKRQNSPTTMQQTQPLSQYYDTTIHPNVKQTQNQSLSPHSSFKYQQSFLKKSIKKESFSYIKSDRQSMKYLDTQIQGSLKKESFYSYNELSKDMETNISINSDEQKQLKTERSMLRSKSSRENKQEINQQTKMAIFNLIEAKSLYYMEVQKASSKLKNIKSFKDQQQKKMISDKLISDMKYIQKQPSMLTSTDQLDEKDGKQIYKDVFNDLKTLADNYVSKLQMYEKSQARQRIYTQQQQGMNCQSNLNTTISKCKELSKSIQQQKEFF
ncbi:unnamed protein product (macronuclear) [Paramecium tetraurelia]|uniref:Transmembrane protein n=1 Tax=Paramecium tetraurelia TaxID=5888 RepID=A0D7F9_PARTE|nr:uncharacterized protein GSPATT00002018001 [Paramecium tetraurelia]CAK78976.1 unnamed protein product [Paramecium tetraurelia]|eukprot:XP_001446373.1 hypothetical protein (macronuclear) [Paramecium tetraurelia strain d4-2]